MTSLIAFVLPAAHSGEPVNFPGFPGVWTPGEPKAAADLVAAGAFDSVADVVEAVKELGLPLKRVKAVEAVEAAAAPSPRPVSHRTAPDPPATGDPEKE